MAAYAELVSLINNIEQIKNHPRISTMFDEKQMGSLLRSLDFLLDFIETYGGSKEEAEELERQIAAAAHSAEDVIESHIVDQIFPEDMAQSIIADRTVARSNTPLVMLDLQKIIQEMNFIREMVVKAELRPKSSMATASSRPPYAVRSKMVGFGGYLTQLLDKLTGHHPDRHIIPIVGMCGIGKTTLARNAYDSLLVLQHFDVHAWVVISQTYTVRDIFFETLSCLGEFMHGMDEHELSQQLHETLFNRRYLIVLDDMWSIESWDRIKFFFPNNCNGSRILVTTRISDVANHFGSIGVQLNLLDDAHSWELFCEEVFPQEVCPLELETSGKKIVNKCGGLPLPIVVIGGLLRNSSRTQHEWENVAKDVSSKLNTAEDNRCFKLLSLSYSHLPACLRPCFLYLGIFPENNVINVSRLIKLWVAE